MCAWRCCQNCRQGRRWRQWPKESASPTSQCPPAHFPVRQTQAHFPPGSPGPRLYNTASPWTQSKKASLGTEVLTEGHLPHGHQGSSTRMSLVFFSLCLEQAKTYQRWPRSLEKLGVGQTLLPLQGTIPLHQWEALDGDHSVLKWKGRALACLTAPSALELLPDCSEESYPECSDWWLT